jgi:type I restriction enzyme S subunit
VNDKAEATPDLEYIGLEHIESWSGKKIEPTAPVVTDGVAHRFRRGDVLFGKLRPYLAKVLCADSDGMCSTEALVLSPRLVNQRYLFYYLISRDFIHEVDSSTYGSKMPRASWNFIGNMPCLLPPRGEQQAIAAWLDDRTKRIDDLIAAKRRLIELLVEQRIALITRATTQGIRGGIAFQSHAIDHYPEFAEHWKVRPLKHFSNHRAKSFVDGDWIETPYIADQGIRLIQCGNIGTGEYVEQGFRFISEGAFEELACTPISPGDVLICRMRSSARILAGRACLAPALGDPMVTAVDNCIVKCADDVDARYLVYLLSSKAHLEFIEAVARGGTRDRISRSMLGSVRLPSPPVAEQREIADYLERVCEQCKELSAKAADAVERLQEYRQALITAAVTGQIDVGSGT